MRRVTGLMPMLIQVVVYGFGAATTVSAEYPVAGVQPEQRPAGAPVIQQVQKNGAWYARALTGLQPPYPASMRFLEDQGNWFTPFSHPGMTGRYDLRKWYRQ